MSEGLEFSEISVYNLERTLRLDSEFYAQHNLALVQTLKRIDAEPLVEFANVSDGNHMSISDKFIETGVPYYRGGDTNNLFIEFANPYHIPYSIFESSTFHRSHLCQGDILVSIVGTIGNISLVSHDTPSTCSCKLAILRPKNNISSAFLGIYLKSRYGQNHIQKFRRGSVQTGLILEDFDQILVPKISQDLKAKVTSLVVDSLDCYKRSIDLYAAAENYLLDLLGMRNFTAEESSANIVSVKESFLASGRLDAEYYHPKYDLLFERLAHYPTKTIREIAQIQKSIEPGSDAYQSEGIPFIRVSDLTPLGLSKPAVHLDAARFSDALRPKKDTILLSKDGSIGIAYKMEKDADIITSGAILHLNVITKDVLPDYLTLILNSMCVRMQAERDAGGSIIQHWKPSEIEKVIVPILPMSIQEELTNKISNCFLCRRRSEELLNQAVGLVEQAIETA